MHRIDMCQLAVPIWRQDHGITYPEDNDCEAPSHHHSVRKAHAATYRQDTSKRPKEEANNFLVTVWRLDDQSNEEFCEQQPQPEEGAGNYTKADCQAGYQIDWLSHEKDTVVLETDELGSCQTEGRRHQRQGGWQICCWIRRTAWEAQKSSEWWPS